MEKNLVKILLLIVILYIALISIVYAQTNNQSSTNGVTTYVNPIQPGEHPDQTLLQVGNDFYSTGSSFHFTPYVPILHSTDLVHWEVIARVVPANWAGLNSDAPAAGIWQGALAYFNNKYWVYFSNSNCCGQYFCNATSPEGPWSAPTKVTGSTVTGYDNSIFVDDDGTPYMLMKNGQAVNLIQQIDPTTGQLTGTLLNLDWVNTGDRYSWAEGPVMCKRNGIYYYFVAGNVTGGQYVLSSPTLTANQSSWSLLGNFFSNATSPGGLTGPNHISQPVQLADGTWWCLSHSYDNSGWYGQGRLGLLHQVIWDANGTPQGVPPNTNPVEAPNLPNTPNYMLNLPKADLFGSTTLSLDWHFFNKAMTTNYSLTANPGSLTLNPGTGATHILQKEGGHYYSMVTKVTINAAATGEQAGLRMTNGDDNLFATLYAGYNGGKKIGFAFNGSTTEVNNTIGNTVWLKIQRVLHSITGYYSADGKTWTQVGGAIDVSTLDAYSTTYDEWVGTSIGLYATGISAYYDLFVYKDGFSSNPLAGYNNYYGVTTSTKTPGTVVTNSNSGDWLMLGGVSMDFNGTPSSSIVVNAASASGTGTLQVWIDNIGGNGTQIAAIPITSSGGTNAWQNYSANINVTGQHDLYFKFIGSAGVFSLNTVTLQQNTCTTAAPVVTSPITYCQGSTATALKATAGTGGTLNWYTTSSGGTASAAAPTPSISTAGSTTYYVSQTIGCESPRASIVVTVNALPTAPTVTSPVSYCQNTNASALTATGTSLKWYTAASGGTGSTTTPTPSTTTSGTTSYYVSQTANTCESPRASIAVAVNALPVITPYVQLNGNWLQQNTALSCAGTTIALGPQPVVTNGWTWTGPNNYTSTARQITLTNLTIAQGGVYIANYTDANGCKTSANITVTVNAIPSAPTVSSPVTYCQGTTASALTATAGTGGTLNWYGTNTAGGIANTTAPMPSTTTIGTTSYYVSQTVNTCESPRSAIAVAVNAIPSAPTATSLVTYCQNGAATALTANGTSLNWYTASSGGTGSITAPTPSTTTTGTTSYYVSQTINTCESPRSAIAVTVNAPPTASNAGTDQYITTTSTALSANTPTTGVGSWSVVNGTANFSNPASATSSVSGLSSGANVLQWTISNGSCTPSSSTVTINVGNSPTSQTITGSAYVAKDSSATYAITTPSGVSNHWSVPVGATIASSNSDSSQVTISFGTTGGAVNVTQTNSFGSTVDTEGISVGASPVTQTITGPAYIATGSAGVNYSAPDNSGSTYHWTLPAGAIITSANTDSSQIIVSYGASVITGTVSVTETNPYGSATSSLPVSVGNAPSSQSITGTDSVTVNETGVVYSIPDKSGSSYHWTLPAGATITSANIDSSNVTVSFGSTGGTVKVTETNPYGTASSSIPVSISTTTTAVISKTGGNFIEVKPNPFNDYATIMVHSETTEPIMLTVINVQGVICYSSSQYSTNQEFTIGSELQSDGLFFVQITNSNETKVLKLIKIK